MRASARSQPGGGVSRGGRGGRGGARTGVVGPDVEGLAVGGDGGGGGGGEGGGQGEERGLEKAVHGCGRLVVCSFLETVFLWVWVAG